ncbi:MAG TPA: 50S ribosomal protein L3 [Bacillota bacterium]|nr:50S ribosomal protein L3 [Bacillota bacterium]HOO30396.1 50S ribosomal protein L3 [Bacillota bacterium]HPZ13371.1 50S ribosomal protein L3 [Bacillota bacterium]HQD79445.1 50S ribosomal protein L3 [Bacillota bacterium]
MGRAIIGRKIGMTQIFEEDGRVHPVTVIEAGPCCVVQKKHTATDGYEAVQLGFGEIDKRRVSKPMAGHYAKANVKPSRHLKEFRIESADAYELGQEIKVDQWSVGDLVDVTGISRGKGFAGPMKRWNFSRGPMAHGSHYHRGVGSLGATAPARVFRGRKMAGRLGGTKATSLGLEVVKVDPERNLLMVRGSIPGATNGLVTIRDSVKAKAK